MVGSWPTPDAMCISCFIAIMNMSCNMGCKSIRATVLFILNILKFITIRQICPGRCGYRGTETTRNHLLATLLPPLLHKDTLVLLIQNGIGPEPELQKQFPDLYLAAGLAFICSSKTELGRVNHQCYGSINIGNYSCKDTQIMDQLIADFNQAGVKALEVEYREARWKKAVWNMPFNGMTVVMNAQTDQLLANPATRELIHRQMMEVIGAAQALGVQNIDASFADKMIDMTLTMTPYSPSMKLDYDFHRPMEIAYLYSHAIAEAHTVGYSMPCLEMLEAQLKFLDVSNS